MQTDIKHPDILAFGFSESFISYIEACCIPVKKHYSVVVISDTAGSFPWCVSADYIICPCKSSFPYPICCKNVITCGMQSQCTLSFSGIRENSAMLSLSRSVNGYTVGEIGVKLRNGFSLYENLVIQALRLIGCL